MKSVTLSGRNLSRYSLYIMFVLVFVLCALNCGKNNRGTTNQATSGFRTGTFTGIGNDFVNFENYFWPWDEDWRWIFHTLDLSMGVQEYTSYKEIMNRMVFQNASETIDVYPLESSPIPWYGQPPNYQFLWYFAKSKLEGEILCLRFAIKPSVYWELDPAWVWGKRNMSVGQTIQLDATATMYAWGGQNLYSDEQMSLIAVYEGREDEPVITPLGTFPNVIRMSYTIIRGGLPWYVEKMWFSWGDGIIKTHITELPCCWHGFTHPLSLCPTNPIQADIRSEVIDIWYPH